MRRWAWLVAVVLVMSACTLNAADETTITTAPHTTTSTVATTTTVMETTTTLQVTTSSMPERVVVDTFTPSPGSGDVRGLREGTVWVMPLAGATLEFSPPTRGWVLLGLSNTRAVFGWSGPAGPGTLEAVVHNIGFDGPEAAWARIEALGDGLEADLDWEWSWMDRGTGLVGDREAEWREVRLPPVPEAEVPDWDALPIVQTPYPVVVGHDSTARFYVVPFDDGFTVTVMVWESRCVCPPLGLFLRGFVDRDVENELSMWIDELEAFLAGMEFVED